MAVNAIVIVENSKQIDRTTYLFFVTLGSSNRMTKQTLKTLRSSI
jgi:hypothetical protein